MTTSSSSIAREFIEAINDRDVSVARVMMADGATMTFPGGNTFTDVGAFLDWAKGRYRKAVYSYDDVEEIAAGSKTIVYARGSIEGELNDGEKFAGIRVVDRFEMIGGKIVRKEAWSDMADYLRKKAV